jgi:hypothetical protein
MSISQPDSQTFERRVLDNEGQKLTYYSEKSNRLKIDETTEKLFINLSLKEILMNISLTIINIINDIVQCGIRSPRDILSILGRDDRLIYVGIVIIFISFGIYVVDIL